MDVDTRDITVDGRSYYFKVSVEDKHLQDFYAQVVARMPADQRTKVIRMWPFTVMIRSRS